MKLEEKRDFVQKFFSATGETYDHIVKICTFGIDGWWKQSILNTLDNPGKVLDLACGTGILTFAIAKRFPKCQIVGVDITEGYLNVARRKADLLHAENVRFIQQWAEEVSSDELFDCITSSYLAKYADLSRLVRNSASMLKPGGLLLFHDFTYPQSRMIALSWELYFKLLRNVGSLRYPQWRNVFIELPDLIRKTRWVEDLTSAMRNNYLTEIRVKILTLQGATLVTGRKPLL
ncbi:MAG TPA: class I SAM-dependent methyltransferase [Nitrospiria bacterium]|nr:class I SAM-dependent methyltransferase [Nitrospiria bacterium]